MTLRRCGVYRVFSLGHLLLVQMGEEDGAGELIAVWSQALEKLHGVIYLGLKNV